MKPLAPLIKFKIFGNFMPKKIEMFLACAILVFISFVLIWDNLIYMFRDEPVSKTEIVVGAEVTGVYRPFRSNCYFFNVKFKKEGVDHEIKYIQDLYFPSKWNKTKACNIPPLYKKGDVVNIQVFYQQSILGGHRPTHSFKLPYKP